MGCNDVLRWLDQQDPTNSELQEVLRRCEAPARQKMVAERPQLSVARNILLVCAHWALGSVRTTSNVLHNRAYVEPGIISEELWQTVQDRIHH